MSEGSTPPSLPLGEVEHIVAQIVGPFLVATLVNTFLFGSSYIQTYIYARTCQSDPKWRKVLVAVIFVLDILHVICLCYAAWLYGIKSNGNVEKTLQAPFFPLGLSMIVGAIIVAMSQVFFSWRVYAFSVNAKSLGICSPSTINVAKIITAIAIITSLAQTAFTVAIVVFTHEAKSLAKIQDKRGVVVGALTASFALATDTMNFGALAWCLYKSDSAFQPTKDTLAKLTRATIQTGAILVLYNIANVATFLPIKTNTATFVFTFSLPNLYTNCFMSSLNERIVWGDGAASSKAALNLPLSSPFNSDRSPSIGHGSNIVDPASSDSVNNGATRMIQRGQLHASCLFPSYRAASDDGFQLPMQIPRKPLQALEGGRKSSQPNFPLRAQSKQGADPCAESYPRLEHVLDLSKSKDTVDKESYSLSGDSGDDHVEAQAI